MMMASRRRRGRQVVSFGTLMASRVRVAFEVDVSVVDELLAGWEVGREKANGRAKGGAKESKRQRDESEGENR